MIKKIKIKFYITVILLISAFNINGQETPTTYNDKKKGQLSISWGWNRAAYTKSNISFKGSDYNFKLYNVKSHDVPVKLTSIPKYLQINKLTIPQTNLRISYFIKDNLAISFGDDHMKYVMTQNQSVRMKGIISRNGKYKKSYDENVMLTEDFLTFEHTDGLNYLNFELEKYFTWYHSASNKFILSGMIGGGTGILMPKTNVRLLDYERNDRFHVSGFGLSAKAGVQATFFKHFIIKAENKYGYINMPDIVLHKKGIEGRAKQSFFFGEFYATLGATFNISKKQKLKSDK